MAGENRFPSTAEGLMAVLKVLRGPDGCPWDKAQTRHTLTAHLAGECAELIDAVDKEDPVSICDEAGDVLMNLFLQIAIAEEKGEFVLADVWQNEIAKMVRRHAHIFGDEKAGTAEEVTALWEKIKAGERAGKPVAESILDDVPHYLSALTRAEKLQKKAAKVGFDWEDQTGIMAKIREEVSELEAAVQTGEEAAIDEELGDLIFAAVNLIRFRKRSDSEALLRQANLKFEKRFRFIEKSLKAAGESWESVRIERMEALWQAAKKGE